MVGFNDGSKQQETSSATIIDLYEAGAFQLQENKFDLVFITDFMPANIGRFVGEQLTASEESGSRQLTLNPCSREKRDDLEAYWVPKGLPFDTISSSEQILCLNDTQAYLES